MPSFELIIQVITLVVVVVIGYFLREFFPSYTKEKGKNLATKEDIREITEKIESVKADYAKSLETLKSKLQLESALKGAYQEKCLGALTAINELLVEITLYCWKQLAERSPNEHYVWSNVDDLDEKRHFHYYRVAVDKVALIHGMYLTPVARNALSDLSSSIGMLSSMELALLNDHPHPGVLESAASGYSSGLEAVVKCREVLIAELGLSEVGAVESGAGPDR
ncbi:hypothetical protein [Marinimicrobium agarilyticum]|uniref:hypothetical protein n=1 Tax=Marinimicrobium agarilyticum TaxID=306546 RepID=UPI00042034F9|nr:hypothetical protein [Marinimicrobium agarilyticum]